MLKKVLIANRGEIALRILRACKELGIQTVAVYSTADKDLMHIRLADEAVCIGPAPAAESYLNIPAIISAAEISGAEAIHPGYGFLAENADFAERVTDSGFTFIGPMAETIRLMGNKVSAIQAMKEAGVPCVPGSDGPITDDNHETLNLGRTIGFPVIVKAAAGGGGRGMRVVHSEQDLIKSISLTKAEARAAFGDDTVYMEKFLTTPRHVEIQVLADGQGNAIYLGDRDCSLQRRHQKVVEEAPAPGIPDHLRKEVGERCVQACKDIKYRGAGTFEFLYENEQFYFIEINTRIQVEHPVTEAVTGVDLVEWQLRVASGEPLPLAQEQLTLSGHAFEARLYAEDVPKGFLPATGTLSHLSFPDGIRADSGVRPGDTISPWYDPMIAKVIVHGATRGAALNALERALRQTQVGGTVTNIAFLALLAAQKEFAAGDVDTGLIDRNVEDLTRAPVACTKARAMAALAALDLTGGAGPQGGFALWAPQSWPVTLTHGGEEIAARVTVEGPEAFTVDLGEVTHRVETRNGIWFLDETKVMAETLKNGREITVFWGNGYEFEMPDPLDRGGAMAGDGSLIEAPMPGLVKLVAAKAGEAVAEGDRLAVLEAMKMEHALLAARDGVVAEVLVAEGDQVEGGAALIRLEPQD